MEKTISRIRNLRARRKLSLPASPGPGCSKTDQDQRSGSEDDLVEWSVKIRSLIPDHTVDAALKRCEGDTAYEGLNCSIDNLFCG